MLFRRLDAGKFYTKGIEFLVKSGFLFVFESADGLLHQTTEAFSHKEGQDKNAVYPECVSWKDAGDGKSWRPMEMTRLHFSIHASALIPEI